MAESRFDRPCPYRGVFLFEKVGYLLIFFVIALVLPLLAGQITLKRSFLFAVLSAAGVYIIFVWLLEAAAANRLSRKVMHGFF